MKDEEYIEFLEKRVDALSLALKELFIRNYDLKSWDIPEREEYSLPTDNEVVEENIRKYGETSDFYSDFKSTINLQEAVRMDPLLDREIFNAWKSELSWRKVKRREEQQQRNKEAKEKATRKLIEKRGKSKVDISDLL